MLIAIFYHNCNNFVPEVKWLNNLATCFKTSFYVIEWEFEIVKDSHCVFICSDELD